MEFVSTSISDVILIKPKIFSDQRGDFLESYHINKYKENGIYVNFVQDNQVKSRRHVLRGLHYQKKFPQGKLIQCIQGEIFDVAVDIRKSSVTYLKWVSVQLDELNRHQLYIPPGFAHGYVVLSEESIVSYKCTDIYHPEDEDGLFWNDPKLNINWPVQNPILSEKDLQLNKNINE